MVPVTVLLDNIILSSDTIKTIASIRTNTSIAPIPPINGYDPLYDLVGKYESEKATYEAVRLLYVAATRAKKKLHIMGHAIETSKGLKPAESSLLSHIWGSIKDHFVLVNVATPELDVVSGGVTRELKRVPHDWERADVSPARAPLVPHTIYGVNLYNA